MGPRTTWKASLVWGTETTLNASQKARRPAPEGTGLTCPRGLSVYELDGDDAELHQEVDDKRGNGDPEEGLHVARLP